jgi:phospholipase C
MRARRAGSAASSQENVAARANVLAMRRTSVRSAAAFALAMSAAALESGCGGSSVNPGGPGQPAPAAKILHVIVIVQENRTPDNLFHGLPNADTSPSSGLDSQGQQVQLLPVDLQEGFDLDHRHEGFTYEWDGGKLDGWNLEPAMPCSGTCPPAAQRPYMYVPQNQVQPYWDLAEQYVFADRMFQSNRGPSFPAHQYIIGGNALAAPADTPYVIADNPSVPGQGAQTGGCNSPAGTLVELLDPTSGNVEQSVYPCFDHPVLMDLLDAKKISWRYYQAGAAPSPGLWALDAIQHIVDGPDVANISAPSSNILNDIASGNLASVSWVTPTGIDSDHPGDGGAGPSWVASIVNAAGASAYWNSTAVIVTWDDWGGWYDHVPPPTRNANELGFRVPLLVVSPYAKSGYVSHVQYEFSSILKFIEEQFDLGSLGTTDALANDLGDCFDFSQKPRPYTQIQSRYARSYFMRIPPSNRPVDPE